MPLVVNDVVKTYGDGFRAVDGVSFRAEAGQVVGLLGPNGAGKTTVIRMLVGLIRPDSGSIYVNGQPVHAGADVLGSVGAFIEGPGFLPHLSGKAEPHGVLAGHRPPDWRRRTWTRPGDRRPRCGHRPQGPRLQPGDAAAAGHRPGHARTAAPAGAGRADQRPGSAADQGDARGAGRLRRDWSDGRASPSHLLAEVEHTCSHVVVMDQGKVVLTGAVEDLTASDTVTMIGLADVADVGRRWPDAAGSGSASRA